MEIIVFGPRGFGQVHLNALKGVDVSIMERDARVAEDICSRYSISHVYTSIGEALNSNADAVDLVLPHRMHSEIAIEAMKHGKHVLVEKPIATSIEEGNAMISASEKYRKKLMVAEQYFFDSSVREVKKLISDGSIGSVSCIIVRKQQFNASRNWRTKAEDMGGGALIDGGIHYVNTLIEFGGKPVSVQGFHKNISGRIEGEDTSAAIIEFESGANGIFYYSWGYKDPPAVPSFEIIGTDGSIYEDISSNPQFLDKKSNYSYGDPVINGNIRKITHNDVFAAETQEFIACIQEDREPLLSPQRSMLDLKLVMDIYKS